MVPGSGMVTVSNAAAFGVSIVLREETRANAFRLNEVISMPLVLADVVAPLACSALAACLNT